MALKISGDNVVSDSYVLENIANTDNRTDQTINNSIKNQNNVLRIFDSTGTEIRTLFCAATDPQT